MGLKGSGKTKTLVELVKQAVEVESGNVVCIERNKALTYDIPYTVRLINGGDYAICTSELMKGFLCDVFDSLVYFLLEGRRVTLGEIGSFSLSLKSEATASADEFNKDNIKGVNVVFTPSREMKECLANAVFKRISIEEKDHDAIINYLLKNEGYEEELEEHRALCDSCD